MIRTQYGPGPVPTVGANRDGAPGDALSTSMIPDLSPGVKTPILALLADLAVSPGLAYSIHHELILDLGLAHLLVTEQPLTLVLDAEAEDRLAAHGRAVLGALLAKASDELTPALEAREVT